MPKRWRKEDETYLKRYAKQKPAAELAERFGVALEDVEKKLNQLGLTTADGLPGRVAVRVDPAIEVFAAGLEAFHARKWDKAITAFDRVLNESDQSDLLARTRLYREQAEQRASAAPAEEGDPYLEAVVAKNRGDYAAVLEVCARGGRRGKDERFAYLAASALALSGDLDEAVKVLQQAIELNPENRVHAFHDPDFRVLRGHAGFDGLYE
jgi:tetratricopeptide (TPR) repeat protein